MPQERPVVVRQQQPPRSSSNGEPIRKLHMDVSNPSSLDQDGDDLFSQFAFKNVPPETKKRKAPPIAIDLLSDDDEEPEKVWRFFLEILKFLAGCWCWCSGRKSRCGAIETKKKGTND